MGGFIGGIIQPVYFFLNLAMIKKNLREASLFLL
jgi:hypothetical protein